MSDSTVTNSPANNRAINTHEHLVEASLANLREHRDDVARWLAIEVLLSDEPALEDDVLVDAPCAASRTV